MTATGAEQNANRAPQPSEFQTLQQEVARETREQLAEQVRRAAKQAADVKTYVELQLKAGKAPDLGGDKENKDSPKGKATTVKQAVQKALIAAKTPDKIPTPTGKSAEVVNFSSSVLQRLSDHINPEYDISDQEAPYLHDIVNKAVNGELSSVDDLAAQLNNIENLKLSSPALYKKVQESFFDIATKDKNISEAEAKQRLGMNDLEALNNERGGRASFERQWAEMYSSYFSEEDRPFVASLYSADGFTKYVDGLKRQIANGRDPESEAVRQEASKAIERKLVELVGKLYTRLDHEKPSEFFHEVEQQDIMRGIMPVRNELRRRMTQLSTQLEQAEQDGTLSTEKMYKSVEEKADVVDTIQETIKGEKRVKPRYRLNPYTRPEEVSAGEFVHYLDQIADHYIEVRKYTHNARAIFLHPVDPEKGFYSQLAQFANDMSMVDFDQMMALPDNEVFRDAFSMYDKMVEETFASNDWRHFPSMFELKQNSLHTQVEEDVLNKLMIMYAPQIKSGEMTTARLEAALSMAVGASRGMFLNEIEKAAYADPHLDEQGKATFASYYNQDASALMAFNPMHQHYRWQSTGAIDPILFMPVEGLRGSEGYFRDHRQLWKKMQAYKDSFVSGRAETDLKGQTLWADFLVNIGKVGGPMQRKGWRTSYMLEPLYVRDETKKDKGLVYDYLKTWQVFENIGYDVMTDVVGKLPFLGEYRGRPGGKADMLKQKNELFAYVYEKYFRGEGGSLNAYLDPIRSEVTESVMAQVKAGTLRPNDVRSQIETDVSNRFLYRALARMVAERIPSKILRMDRDRFSDKGVGRWRQIAEEMKLDTKQFDGVMQDLLTAEQLLRKNVSSQMHDIVNAGRPQWETGNIEYKMTEQRIQDLLGDKIDQGRIDQAKALFRKINDYVYKDNAKFLDKNFSEYLRKGEYKFSFALDELDMSFVPWRGAGARVLPRAIGDISTMEKNVTAEVVKLPKILQNMSIDGKRDLTPVLELMTKVYGALDGAIGTDYAQKVIHHIAGVTINYFKKDTTARVAYGLFGLNRKNSLAAERAGGSSRVWEWDSTDIDRFCLALESRALLPREPFNPTNSKPEYNPVYIKLPFVNQVVQLPKSFKIGKTEIPLFAKRKPDYEYTIKQLRKDFGGNWKDIAFDYINRYLPLIIAWLLWKYISDANKEAEGKKK